MALCIPAGLPEIGSRNARPSLKGIMRLILPEQLTGQHRCAVTGRTQDPEGFIDLRVSLSALVASARTGEDPDICLSVAIAKEIARELGWIPPEEIKDYVDRLNQLGEDFAAANDRLDKLTTLRDLEAELEVSA